MTDPVGSTYSHHQEGLSAIYTALRPMGAVRWERAPDRLTDEIGVLVVWRPRPVSDPHWKSLMAWVSRGNTLVIAEPKLRLPGTATALGDAGARSAAAHPAGVGVESVAAGPWAFRRIDRTALPHLVREDGAVVMVSYSHGAGRIYWSADHLWLANAKVGEADNLRLALGLLTPPEGKQLAFEEFHHRPPLAERWWQILRGPLQAFTLQVMIAIAFLYWAYGARFGQPRPLPAGPDRAAVEYVYSMSNLLRRARARPFVTQVLYRSLVRDLSKLVGGATGLSHADLARRAAPLAGMEPAALETLLNRLAPDRAPAPAERELIALAAEAETLQRRIHNAGYIDRRDASANSGRTG